MGILIQVVVEAAVVAEVVVVGAAVEGVAVAEDVAGKISKKINHEKVNHPFYPCCDKLYMACC